MELTFAYFEKIKREMEFDAIIKIIYRMKKYAKKKIRRREELAAKKAAAAKKNKYGKKKVVKPAAV